LSALGVAEAIKPDRDLAETGAGAQFQRVLRPPAGAGQVPAIEALPIRASSVRRSPLIMPGADPR
jgi:hypothetical protein